MKQWIPIKGRFIYLFFIFTMMFGLYVSQIDVSLIKSQMGYQVQVFGQSFFLKMIWYYVVVLTLIISAMFLLVYYFGFERIIQVKNQLIIYDGWSRKLIIPLTQCSNMMFRVTTISESLNYLFYERHYLRVSVNTLGYLAEKGIIDAPFMITKKASVHPWIAFKQSHRMIIGYSLLLGVYFLFLIQSYDALFVFPISLLFLAIIQISQLGQSKTHITVAGNGILLDHAWNQYALFLNCYDNSWEIEAKRFVTVIKSDTLFLKLRLTLYKQGMIKNLMMHFGRVI